MVKINKYLIKHQDSFAFVFDHEKDYVYVIFFDINESKVVSFYHGTLGYQFSNHIFKDGLVYLIVNDQRLKEYMLKFVDRLKNESNGFIESIKNISIAKEKNRELIGNLYFPFVLTGRKTTDMSIQQIETELFISLQRLNINFEYETSIRV